MTGVPSWEVISSMALNHYNQLVAGYNTQGDCNDTSAAFSDYVVIVGVIAVYFVRFMQQNNWYQPRITQAQVRQEIRRGLPMGSTVPRTIAFLKGIGAETDTSTYPNRSAQSTDGFEQQDPSGSMLTAAFLMRTLASSSLAVST